MSLRALGAGATALVVATLLIVRALYFGDDGGVAHLRLDAPISSTSHIVLPPSPVITPSPTTAIITPSPTATRTQAPTSASPTPPPPPPHEEEFPLWLPPSPNTSVQSSYGDFEWVYPAILDRAEFARQRFTANELAHCGDPSLSRPCCSIGSRNGPNYASTYGAGMKMNYMMEFRPIPHRALFSLVDVFKAWRRANSHRAGTRMKLMFIGDSITNQVFTAAVCELARNAAVERMTYNSQPRPPFRATPDCDCDTSFQESHFRLKGEQEEGNDYEVLYVRQFKWSINSKVMRTLLADADVIVFGLGIHYGLANNPAPELIPNTLESIVRALKQTHDPAVRNRTLMWMGDPRQHYRYAVNDSHVTGLYDPLLVQTFQYCGPVARTPPDHALALSMSHRVHAHFSNNQSAWDTFLPSSWFRWNATRAQLNPPSDGSLPHMHFLPFYELTSPYYENKADYTPDTTRMRMDCTHIYAAPNFYESLWDAMYVLVAATIKDDDSAARVERFPAGGQQYPNWVPFVDGTLDYVGIILQLRGEVF